MPRNRLKLFLILFIFLGVIAVFALNYHNQVRHIAYSIVDQFNKNYKSRLFAPTMIYKTEKYYYITDCLHGRVIYCDSLDRNINHWKTLYDKVTGVHSIASDGRFVVFDDTEGSRLLVYDEANNALLNDFRTPSARPHFIQYDSITNRFYALCSTGGIIITLVRKGDSIEIERQDTLHYLSNHYVRSFNIIDGDMFFVPGRNQRPPKVFQVDYRNNFLVKDSFEVPNEISNSNYIDKIGNYFYLTSLSDSTANQLSPQIVKVLSISDLRGGGVNLYPVLDFKGGAPYYIQHIDGHVYIAFISDVNGIKQLTFHGDSIVHNENVFLFDHISLSSKLRERYLYPKAVIQHKSRKNFFENRK